MTADVATLEIALCRALDLLTELAREAPTFPSGQRIDPMNLERAYREAGKIAKDEELTGEAVINLETNGVMAAPPLTTYGDAYARAEIAERCAELLRELRGYV